MFGAQVFEGAVVAAVTNQLAMINVDRDVGDGIEKLAVVADDDQRTWVAFEPGFQPDEGVQVEVVGRFVEQQQV